MGRKIREGGCIVKKIYVYKETGQVEQIIRDNYEDFKKYNELTFGDNFFYFEIEDSKTVNLGDRFDIGIKFEKVYENDDNFYNGGTEIVESEEKKRILKLEEENKMLNEKLDKILELLK